MLFTRNAYYFRKFFKEEVARETSWLDLKFVGSLHPDKKRTETGFSKLIYGNREDLGKLLGTIALNVAADDQAIYELIQNADDCKSSFFSVSYNEKYLLCINNGNYFSDDDMSAIINVAGNYKEGEDIGTFGIGFKILHRLVGVDDGRDAIINDYAGPIIFSWNRFFQLEKFLNGDEVKVGYNEEKDKENPWLIKILYTCFPSHLCEKLKLKDYDTEGSKFESNELQEMRDFLKVSLNDVNLHETNYLKTGSIFFLKLGDGKSKFLDDGIEKIKSGLAYSFKFLNSLKKIYINSDEIRQHLVDDYSGSFFMDSPEFEKIKPKNKKRDIKFTFAFYRDYRKAEHLRNELVPNLYTFFSMDEEKNGFNFLLHCNAFDMNNDRRKLQANSQINENLLPLIAKEITNHIDLQKDKDRKLFLSLYANLLLSKEPINKPHINISFFQHLKDYLYQNVPTQEGSSNNPKNVKIKNTSLDISPSEFGCVEIEWFHWSQKSDDLLIREAQSTDKLDLEKWNIIKLIEYAVEQEKIEYVENWINSSPPKTYFSLLKEIEKYITKTSLIAISKVKLFKFSDEKFHSLNEIFNSDDLVLNYEKTSEIRFELQAIGFISSYINIDDYPNIKELIQSNFVDLDLFQQVTQKVKNNTLRKEQKHKLFFGLAEFDNVGTEKLKDLELFKDVKGNIQPLRNLLKGDLQVSNWLFPYKIHIAEYIPELDKFLVKEKEIYQSIILPHWDTIISSVTNIPEFYQKVKQFYDQDESNTPLKNQSYVFLNAEDGFVSASETFYNAKFSKIGNYKYFQNVVQALTDTPTPHKDILSFLNDTPFKVDDSDLFDFPFNKVSGNSYQEVKSLLDFCKVNNENFFEYCIIEKQGKDFCISPRNETIFQVRPPKKEIKQFIEEDLYYILKILPFELDEFKDEKGIVQGEELYNLIVSIIDVDSVSEQFIDILAYDEPKRNFLLQLSEIRFASNEQYVKDSFAFKIINLACTVLKPEDYPDFRCKIIIETDEEELPLSNIPPFTDKIKIDDYELSLSKILPNTYRNSDHVGNLLSFFVDAGMNKNRVNDLFGITEEPELADIFNLFSEETPTLENAEQLAFLFLVGLHVTKVDFSQFNAVNILDEEVSLKFDKYLNEHKFLNKSEVLHAKYKNITKYFKKFPVVVDYADKLLLFKEPFFEDNEFICHYLIEEMTDEQKQSFVEFLFYQWDKKDKKTVIRSIDWGSIDGKETFKILGFNPKFSVFPSDYALDSEKLPEYLQNWIANDTSKINFLSDLGIFVEGSALVTLRKFFLNQGMFDKNKIARDSRFTDDETILFNTFEWLKEKELELENPEEFDVFEEIVRVINTNREKGQELIIQNFFDFELLESEAIEWDASYYLTWKESVEEKFEIFLFEGLLPRIVKLDEIDDYIFYRYHKGDIVIDENNRIYINRNTDIKKALSSLIAEDNDFSTEDLLLLYQTKETVQTENDEVDELRSEIERLRQVIEGLLSVSGRDATDVTTRTDEYLIEIKEKSEAYLFEVLKGLYPNHNVKWLNYNEVSESFHESWQDHDFEILDSYGNVLHYIDCKGTPRQKRTFYLTSNEWDFFLNCVQKGWNYQIFRVFDMENSANYVQIDNLWEWIEAGKVVPYLTATETIKGGRVFLTLM
jgi:hypothetical protein